MSNLIVKVPFDCPEGLFKSIECESGELCDILVIGDKANAFTENGYNVLVERVPNSGRLEHFKANQREYFKKIKSYMRENWFDCDNWTTLAESAASEFDYYEDLDYTIPEELFEFAMKIGKYEDD